MTRSQIIDALHDEGREPLPGEFSSGVAYVIPKYAIGSDTLKAILVVGTSGLLERVTISVDDSLNSRQSVFASMEEELTKKYGSPSNKVSDRTSMHDRQTRVWAFPTTTIELQLYDLYVGRRLYASMLLLTYEPSKTAKSDKL